MDNGILRKKLNLSFYLFIDVRCSNKNSYDNREHEFELNFSKGLYRT